MTKQFTVMSSMKDLRTDIKQGAFLKITRNNESIHESDLNAFLPTGELVGFVGDKFIGEKINPDTVLYEMMKEEGNLDGRICKVVEHGSVFVGENLTIIRGALIVEPI